MRIVDAGGDRAVEGHLVHESEKGVLDIFHVAVAVHVFAVEIGNDGENGRELEERAVAFVGLGHKVLRGAETGVGTHGVDPSTHDHCGVEPAGAEDAGHHGSGRRFAMHAGDGDAVFEAHEFGQHFSALDDGNLAGAGLDDLGVAVADRRTCYHDSSAGDMARLVAFIDNGAELRQPVGDRGAAQIGTGDLHLLVQQDFGDTAHADAADANEMCVLGGGKHWDAKVKGTIRR